MKTKITIGELIARYVEALGVKAAFGVISIHNMPILDGFHTRGRVRFVPARGEAGATNMADAYARVTGHIGVCVTSTGTGAGNAAGALVEAMTAGTPLLHFTGQIDSPYVDKDWGFIHEAPAQAKMLEAVGKACFRIRDGRTALGILHEATRLAFTPPCGPVSIEIPIDVQQSIIEADEDLTAQFRPTLPALSALKIDSLFWSLRTKKRPLLWLGGGARDAHVPVMRLVEMGFGVVTSTQGRGVIAENHLATLGAFNTQPSAEALYAACDAMIVVGSRLRSNETLGYHLKLPAHLIRIDANPLAQGRGYPSETFVCGDARTTLDTLADVLDGVRFDPTWHAEITKARTEAEALVDKNSANYAILKNAINVVANGDLHWVRDITLSNSIWGNRSVRLNDPRAGLHALGGGIGQGLQMGIGAAIASAEIHLPRKTVALVGDGGFMLNVGELACAVQENANLIVLLMNDGGYGVIKNIQDVHYGARHCYVDLHTPNFAQLCASMGAAHTCVREPAQIERVLRDAWKKTGVQVIEIDMHVWGPFAVKFAGPPKRT